MNKAVLYRSVENLQNQRILRNIRAFGTNSMSYSALQDGIKEFRHPSFKGFIPYTTAWGVDYVLSDPIAPKGEMLKATIVFLEKHKNALFCQISHDYAALLSQLNFKINGLGVEHTVNLEDFKVTWKKRKCLKSYLSKLNKQKYLVFEFDADPKKVWEINEQWLNGKQASKELKFMARPFTSVKEEDVRTFYLIKDKEVLGFCTFDPIYSDKNNGEISSYTLQHLRVANDAPLGSQDFLILNALFQFKEEGFKEVSLGLAPLYKRDHAEFKYSKFAEKIFQMIYQADLFYNYRTIGEHKDHYKADKKQTYLAVNKSFTLRQLFGLLKVNNLI